MIWEVFRKLKWERHEGDNNRVKKVAGNCNENSVVREKDSFEVDLRVHGVSQDAIYKDEERTTKIQTLVDKLQDGIAPIPSSTMWERKVYPTCSAKHRGAQSKKWEISNCTN